jgi:hypothetical protein
MASFLKGLDEYLQLTAGIHQKLVMLPPKPKATLYEFKTRQPAKKKIELPELTYERACMLASDMNLPISWAESVAKLRAIERPKIIPQNSWQDIKAACDLLYKDDFALLKLIISNDWLLEDIYGCNKFAPLTRVDCMGLLLLLHQGDEVVGVNRERIKILRRSGKVNYLHKRLDQQIKVSLLHEL